MHNIEFYDRVVEASKLIDPVFLNSPQFRADALLTHLGKTPLLKLEIINPIRSFKGRGASLLMQKMKPDTEIVCASVGNFGQGMAFAATSLGLSQTVFLSKNVNPLKASKIEGFGANVIYHGADFDEAKIEARRYALEREALFIEDGSASEVTIGAGTIGLELINQSQFFDALVLPVGNGALLNGVAAAVKHKNPNVRVIGVCAKGAPCMAMSWRSGVAVNMSSMSTIAEGIAVREAVPEAVRLMKVLADDVVMVSDDAMIHAMKMCYHELGVVVEPAGVAGLAAMLESPEAFPESNVATVLCGGNVTSNQAKLWL